MKNFKMLLCAAAAVLSMQQSVMGMDTDIKGIISRVIAEKTRNDELGINPGIWGGRFRQLRMGFTRFFRGSRGTTHADQVGVRRNAVSEVCNDQNVQQAAENIRACLSQAEQLKENTPNAFANYSAYVDKMNSAVFAFEEFRKLSEEFDSAVKTKLKSLSDSKAFKGKIDNEQCLSDIRAMPISERRSVKGCTEDMERIMKDVTELSDRAIVNTVFEKLVTPLDVLSAKVEKEIGKLEWKYGSNLNDFRARIENAKGWHENVACLKERVKSTIEEIIGTSIRSFVSSEKEFLKGVVEAVISDIASRLESAINQAEEQLKPTEGRTDTANTAEEPTE